MTQQISLRKAMGFVTNIDQADQLADYFLRVRGLRNSAESYLGQRDYGTKHRYASYPSGITIKRTFVFIDPTTATEYDIVIGLDSSNNLRIFVWDTDPLDSTAKWMEISKKITAVVNDGAIGATDTNVDIGTIRDILNSVYVPATNEFTMWIAYNSTRGNYTLIGSNTATQITSLYSYLGGLTYTVTGATNAAPIVITTSASHGLSNGNVVDIVGVGGNTAANGPWEVANVTATTFELVGSIGNAAYTTGGTVRYGLSWQNGDSLVLFRVSALIGGYTYGNGTEPHVEFNSVEQVKKLNVYYGSANSATAIPTMRKPVQIQRVTDTKNYFLYSNSGIATPRVQFDFAHEFRWFMEHGGGGLIPFSDARGSAASPIASATNGAVTVTDENSNGFMAIRYTFAGVGVASSVLTGLRIKFTVMYDGYEESDPLYTIYAKSSATGTEPEIRLRGIFVNPAKITRRITAINVYVAYANNTQVVAGWTEADSDYFLLYSVPFLAGQYYDYSVGWASVASGDIATKWPIGWTMWQLHPETEYAVRLLNNSAPVVVNPTGLIGFDARGASILLSNRLGHASDTSRSIVTARYATKATRNQGSVVVIDQNDSTLRVSSYNGELVHEDDNFPIRSVDNSGNKLRIVLTSTDTLNGLAVNSSVICAFKTREIETYDLYSGVQGIVPADFFARRSLVTTPWGLFWCGLTGIYWMPSDGGSIRLINRDWQNFYDGTLLTDDGSKPYITNAYRGAIIGGYDPYFQEIWFHSQVNVDTIDGGGSEYLNFRFSPKVWLDDPRKAWSVRQLNIGSSAPVQAFASKRSDGTLVIAYASGLLKYPYITKDDGTEATYRFQDDVTSADATASKGIPTRFLLHVGEISDKLRQHILTSIIPDFKAGYLASTRPLLTLEFYANKEATPFDTQTWPLTEEADDLRFIERRGKLSELRIKGYLDSSASQRDAKHLNISGLILTAEELPRGGNV